MKTISWKAEHFGDQVKSEVDLNLDSSLDSQGDDLRVLLLLTMHVSPPLASGALRLLFRYFSQRHKILQAGPVTLLCQPLRILQAEPDIDGLRLLVEKSEFWIYKAKMASAGQLSRRCC